MIYIKLFLLLSIYFLSVEGFAQGQISRLTKNKNKNEYIDLGLPSGTLWAKANESEGFYTYEEAVYNFGRNLPSKEQFEELKTKCHWTWNRSGYRVTGPNGNSIILPAEGGRDCYGKVGNVGSYGNYWSTTPDGLDYAWYLVFYSKSVYMLNRKRCYGVSVRLVQNK